MPNHTDNRVVLSHEDAAEITRFAGSWKMG